MERNTSTVAVATSNPYVGLRPYTSREAAYFCGRDRQVDELLSLFQTRKFTGVLGQAGSGKTSLVQAGLVPALERGFNGMAGKEWVTCRVRPGRAPLRNLAYALGNNALLDPDKKTTTEFVHRIEARLRHSNAGILETYRRSPIAGTRNLLLFVDQLEDLFIYAGARVSDDSAGDEAQHFITNLLRASVSSDEAIYVVVGMRSEFLGELHQYRRLQQELNQGHLILPRFRSEDLRRIMTVPVAEAGLTFADAAQDSLIAEFASDMRLLPALQYLLHRSVDHWQSEGGSPIITADKLAQWGGLAHCLDAKLEAYFAELDPAGQLRLEQVMRGITRLGSGQSMLQPQPFRVLSSLTGEDRAALLETIAPLMEPPFALLERMPAILTPVEVQGTPIMASDDFIQIRNPYLVSSWQRLEGWVLSEKDSVDTYLRLAHDAARFHAGATGYLRPPDLDILLKWEREQKPTAAWAERYHPGFAQAIEYLFASEQAYLAEVQAKEQAQKDQIRGYRRRMFFILITSLVVVLAMSGLYSAAQYASNEAQKQATLAQEAREKATREAALAKAAELRANEEATNARNAEERANAEALIAKQAQAQEENARRVAMMSLEEEKRARQEALAARSAEEQAKKLAEKSFEAEKVAKIDADNRKRLAELQKEFFTLETELNQSENPAEVIDRIVQAYAEYEEASQKVHGRVLPNNQLQKLLTKAQVKSEKGKEYSDTPMRLIKTAKGGLRSLAIAPGGLIAAAGDNGLIYLRSNSGTQQVDIGQRVRALTFLDADRLIVGTFQGSLFLIQEGKAERLHNGSGQPADRIVRMLPGFGQDDLLVFTSSGIRHFSVDKKVLSAPQVNMVVWTAYKDPISGRILFSSQDGLYEWTAANEAIRLLSVGSASGKTDVITAMAMLPDRLILGMRSGRIHSFDRQGLWEKRLDFNRPVLTFLEHDSEVTSLQVNIPDKKLYSASLDNKVKVYDYTIRQEVQNYIVTLEGHKQWVWTMDVQRGADGALMLLTADEGGHLLKWYVNNKDLVRSLDK